MIRYTLLLLALLNIPLFAQSPRIVINASGHTAKIRNLVFTPDAKQIISISEDKVIRFWNAADGKMTGKMEPQIGDGPEGMLYVSAISPDGKLLAVSGYPVKEEKDHPYIIIIDLQTKKEVSLATGHTDLINGLAFTNDSNGLISVSDDGTIRVWAVSDKPALANIATVSLGRAITCLSLNARTQDIALVAGGNDILIYKLKDVTGGSAKPKPKVLKKHEGALNKVAYSPDGLYLASSSETSELIIWNAEGAVLQEIKRLEHMINALAFSYDSKILVGMDILGKGFSWAVQTGSKFTDFNGHDAAVLCAAFLPTQQGNYIVASAGGLNHEIILWNPFNGVTVTRMKGRGRVVRGLSFDDKLGLHIANELDEGQKPKYTSFFDFSSMTLKMKPIEMSASRKVKKAVQQTGENELSLPKGKTITTDPQIDGRILSYEQLEDGSVVVGSDFSLKMFDKNGAIVKEFTGHSGAVRALSVTADGRYICSGGEDQTIMLWRLADTGFAPTMRSVFSEAAWQSYFTSLPVDSLTKEPSKKAWKDVITFLKSNGQKAYKDIEAVYNTLGESIIPFATLFITEDGQFVCWNNRGYFTCSSDGGSLFGWHINKGIAELSEFFDAEQYFDALYSPEEMAKSIVEGKRIEDILREAGKRIFDLSKLHHPSAALFDIALDDSAIKNANGKFYTDATKIPLTIDVYDGGGGIKELDIYQNDKLIIFDKDIKTKGERDKVTKTYMVDMTNEQNEFKVKVINFQKIESRADVFVIDYKGQAIATSTIHILSVGINTYTNASYNLNYASLDAKAFTSKFVEQSKGIFKSVHKIEIYDADATKENIVKGFNDIIAASKPEDVFLFYYAGHGTLDEEHDNEYYFVPTDVTKLYGDSQQLGKKGISATDLKGYLSQVKSQKQVLLLDACHSGGAVKTLNIRAAGTDEKAIVQLARSSGVVMIAASGTKQFATEFEQLKHGVFTYALLEALEGKADPNGDGKITVNEIKTYMEERVPALTQQYGGQAQYPTGYLTGNDFPISVY